MSYEGGDLATVIKNSWSLGGILAPQGSESADVTADPIYFFGHQEPEGTAPHNYVRVIASPLQDIVEHPQYDEVSQNFDITCVWTLATGQDPTEWDNAESYIQQMENEVLRIIRTQYDPDTGIGGYFRTNRRWSIEDNFEGQVKQLRRTMRITLIKFASRVSTVFTGFGVALTFDKNNSQGTMPASNYVYTEVWHIDVEEGWDTVQEYGVQNADGKGVPAQTRGGFKGFVSFQTFAKKADIGSSTTNFINQLIKPLSTGELPKVVLLTKTPDTEGTPSYLNESISCYVTNLKRIYDEENIVVFQVTGKLTKPTVFSLS